MSNKMTIEKLVKDLRVLIGPDFCQVRVVHTSAGLPEWKAWQVTVVHKDGGMRFYKMAGSAVGALLAAIEEEEANQDVCLDTMFS